MARGFALILPCRTQSALQSYVSLRWHCFGNASISSRKCQHRMFFISKGQTTIKPKKQKESLSSNLNCFKKQTRPHQTAQAKPIGSLLPNTKKYKPPSKQTKQTTNPSIFAPILAVLVGRGLRPAKRACC